MDDENRLMDLMPKVGIRPIIDGRRRGVRESLEKQTMEMAKNFTSINIIFQMLILNIYSNNTDNILYFKNSLKELLGN